MCLSPDIRLNLIKPFFFRPEKLLSRLRPIIGKALCDFSFPGISARISSASHAAFLPPSTATVATGTPDGIITVESRLS